MDIFDCVESRRSVRKYERKDVPNELLAQVLTAGTYAPSAGNTQEWEFIIVRDREKKRRLARAALMQSKVEEAPLVIVILANLEKIAVRFKERGKQVYALQDTAACIQNMLLIAHDLGLGACWVGSFDEDEVADVVEIPNRFRPVAMITIGFPIPYEPQDPVNRIPFDKITWQDKYGKEIDWFHPYSRYSRFSFKTLDQQIEELSERLQELREEREQLKKKESSIGSRMKNIFSRSRK